MTHAVTPFSLKDAPALIERLLPVQKLSAEAYKEQMAGTGKTLTALGSYWKGRKPLILNKACVLGCLLPATDNPTRDLEIFEKLMAMDDDSFSIRWKRRFKPKEILEKLSIDRITRPPAKVSIRSFHTNHFKDYLLIIKDWLNTLTNIGSVDQSRTFARGLLIISLWSQRVVYQFLHLWIGLSLSMQK